MSTTMTLVADAVEKALCTQQNKLFPRFKQHWLCNSYNLFDRQQVLSSI